MASIGLSGCSPDVKVVDGLLRMACNAAVFDEFYQVENKAMMNNGTLQILHH